MKVLVFDSEKSDGFAKSVTTIKEAHEKAKKIIKDRGYNSDEWYLTEEDEPQDGGATFVYSHPCRFENVTLFEV